jgi:hypothetical protein
LLLKEPAERKNEVASRIYAVWRIRDLYPGFRFFPITDPRSTTTKQRRGEKFVVLPVLWLKIQKIVFYSIF